MAKKPKRLNITKDDKVMGIVPREKRDLFRGCNEPGKAWFHKDDHVFMKTFCRVCKNADCIRAKGAVSPWETRMAEQVDYLLNDPEFSELTSPEHIQMTQMAFNDISQKAMRLEIARQRQDWTIPEEPSESPTDGVPRVSNPDTTDQFDDAVRKLAEAKGKKVPDLDRPKKADTPAHFQEGDPEPEPEPTPEAPPEPESEWEYDTQYPSSDGSRTYHVTLSKSGDWACECGSFKHRKQCKHLDTVRAWYEDQVAQAEERERREKEEARRREQRAAQPAPKPPAPDPRVPDTRYNTPMPQEGVMVGGGDVPESPMQKRPTPREPADPWSPRQDRVVKPGAKVVLKGSSKKEDDE